MNLKEYDIDFLSEHKAEYNPREISGEAKEGLRSSVDKFGYMQNIIFNVSTGNIVSGHQRLTILKEEGYTKVDVLEIDIPIEKEKELNVLMNAKTITGDFTYEVNTLISEIMTSDVELYDLANLGSLMLADDNCEMEDDDEEEQSDVTVKGMDLMPYEHYDCILMVFEKIDDFLYLSSLLGLDEKRNISAPMVANKKIGKTRCINASRLIDILDKSEDDNE
jgi:hypothetical protein